MIGLVVACGLIVVIPAFSFLGFLLSGLAKRVNDLEIEVSTLLARLELAESELKKEKKFYKSLSYEVFQSRFCPSDDVRDKGEGK